MDTERYKEEADDLLSKTEIALINLEQSPGDQDLISQVFGAFHTIKGSGAMFGFDEIAGFSHEVETIFESVRERTIPVTPELIDLTLSACDVIRKLLAEQAPEDAEQRRIIAKLREMNPESASPELTRDDKPNLKPETKTGVSRRYHIDFIPKPDFFDIGWDPIRLLDELRELGECRITADVDQIPVLDEMVADRCYIHWRIEIKTAAVIDAIRDIFIFVEDNCHLYIEGSDDEKDAAAPNRSQRQETAGKPGAVETKHRKDRSRVKVSSDKLDELVDLVGELVLFQMQLHRKVSATNNHELTSFVETMERITGALRRNAMSMRMLPMEDLFVTFRRYVRDLARELGKEVRLITSGGKTELDKTLMDRLSDPVMHIIRNSIDHGIELPDIRQRKKKENTGVITMSAEHSGAFVVIRISDDGKGLDAEKIYESAIEQGIVSADMVLEEQDVFKLIFHPGVTSQSEITDVSGRGMGMDVVKRAVEALGGAVEVRSRKEEGTEITIKTPLTLSIIEGLAVRVGAGNFIFPLSIVEKCLDSRNVAGLRETIDYDNEMIPCLSLSDILHLQQETVKHPMIVIVRIDGGVVGFEVDKVLGNHQTVVKNLGKVYKGIEGFSGAAIMSDGAVALVLDANRLAKSIDGFHSGMSSSAS